MNDGLLLGSLDKSTEYHYGDDDNDCVCVEIIQTFYMQMYSFSMS